MYIILTTTSEPNGSCSSVVKNVTYQNYIRFFVLFCLFSNITLQLTLRYEYKKLRNQRTHCASYLVEATGI